MNPGLSSPWLQALRAFASEAQATIEPGCVLGLLQANRLVEAKTFNSPSRAYDILSTRPDGLTERAIDFINKRLHARA